MLRIRKFNTAFVVAYHLVLLLLAWGVYSNLDFKKHFNVPEKTPLNRTTVWYFTISTHSTVGFGDITPKTDLARNLVGIHLVLIMVPLLLIFA